MVGLRREVDHVHLLARVPRPSGAEEETESGQVNRILRGDVEDPEEVYDESERERQGVLPHLFEAGDRGDEAH